MAVLRRPQPMSLDNNIQIGNEMADCFDKIIAQEHKKISADDLQEIIENLQYTLSMFDEYRRDGQELMHRTTYINVAEEWIKAVINKLAGLRLRT